MIDVVTDWLALMDRSKVTGTTPALKRTSHLTNERYIALIINGLYFAKVDTRSVRRCATRLFSNVMGQHNKSRQIRKLWGCYMRRTL